MQFNQPKIVKELSYGVDAKKRLLRGINKLSHAVASTLGASGRTVILEDDYGNPKVTKDGVTVANHIILNDPVENIGAMMVKQAAKHTASKAGDGTTTSTVLAKAIIDSYFKHKGEDHSFREVRSGIETYKDVILNNLSKRSTIVTESRLEDISIISTNNDKDLGKLIAEAFKEAGENGVVTVQDSEDAKTYIQTVGGTHIGGTAKSPHFYTNSEKEVSELDKPLVMISASEIDNIRRVQDVLEYTIKSNRSILFIAPLGTQPLTALAMNKAKGNIKVNVIDPPSFGQKRLDILSDLALLTGATVIDDSLGDAIDLISPDVLGSCEKAITDANGTTLTTHDENEKVGERIDYLRRILDAEDHHVLKPHLESRLAILSGGVSILNIGADTTHELLEKKDRVDDAVQAVRAAKKEGILPGGGAAFHYLAANSSTFLGNAGQLTGWEILNEALFAPFNTILENAGLDPFDKEFNIKKWGMGVDVTDGRVKDMRRAGIIDPTLVAKEALSNAVSVAMTILSTDAILSNVRETE